MPQPNTPISVATKESAMIRPMRVALFLMAFGQATLAQDVGLPPSTLPASPTGAAETSPLILPGTDAAAPQATLPVAEAEAAAPTTAAAPMAHAAGSLSPVDMFMAADIVVKGVMAGLLAASVLIWAIWLGKLLQIGASARGLKRGLHLLEGHDSITDPALITKRRLPAVARNMLALVRGECGRSQGLAPEGIRDRAASELEALTLATQRRLQRGVAVIGTVAATAPFIGLFGTVWGIMNSFIGIAETEQTNLAVVAPGIAEALLATGIGLVAAIPAVILYNHLARLLASHRSSLAETGRRVNVLLSRHLDREAAGQAAAKAGLHLAAE
jgi:biopolymer transport protein ExbB